MKTKYTLLGASAYLLGCMGSAQAVINVVEHQTFNDNATPATYTEVGTPSYAGGALVLDGSSGLTFTGVSPLSATDNFGIEVIANATSFDGFDFLLSNSVGATNSGYGLIQQVSEWQAINMGVATSLGTAATTSTEFRLAYVIDDGFAAFYVDGTFIGTTGSLPSGAPTQLNVGFNPADTVATSGFNGSITEVRLFTFEVGEFVEGDLLQRATVIPEPSSSALLGLAGLAFVFRRRK